MILEIITGVVIAALVGAFVLIRRRASRAVAQRHPVGISVERIVGDEWSLAFAGDLPSVALEIEGGEHTGGEVYAWLTSHGAVDVGETRLRLTVRGLAEETVVVRNIRAVTERTAPYSGTLVHCPTSGANAATLLVFDLDEETPKAWQWREDGGRERVGSRPFFEHNNVTLAHQNLSVRAVTSLCVEGKAVCLRRTTRLVVALWAERVSCVWCSCRLSRCWGDWRWKR
jgi:hypothetical protein